MISIFIWDLFIRSFYDANTSSVLWYVYTAIGVSFMIHGVRCFVHEVFVQARMYDMASSNVMSYLM